MLQRQESEENTPVADRRVTTEEFTQAVATLEARKQEEQQRLAGTIPIAQTVQDLGIDAKPDEIWAEVQAQRARDAATQATPPQSQSPEKQIPVSNTPFQALYEQAPRRQRRVRWFPILLIVFFATRFINANVQHSLKKGDNGSSSAPMSASIVTLTEIPNGHMVFCDESALKELQLGTPLPKILVHEARRDNDWTLIKYDGHAYLRGYTLPYSDQALQAQPVKIYNDASAEDLQINDERQITIRLDQAAWQGIAGGGNEKGIWNEITVSHPHLDRHAREAWSP